MPTEHDETLQQRYTREHRQYLDTLALMTPEQIAALQLQLHNALAQRDNLLVALSQLEEAFCRDDYGTMEGRGFGRKALIDARAAIAAVKEVEA